MNNKTNLSIESYHKLNRSIDASHIMHVFLRSIDTCGSHELLIPHMFSYIHDDMNYVLNELKNNGLCDKWLRKP